MPIYDKKYIKTKIKEHDGVIKTKFLGNDVPKENKRYTCIACVTINSVRRMAKKNYPQIYLEGYNYETNKVSTFINTELESGTDDKLKSDSDNYNDNYNYYVFIFDFRNFFFYSCNFVFYRRIPGRSREMKTFFIMGKKWKNGCQFFYF